MKKRLVVILVSLVGFLGCSDSDDDTSNPNYIVQATVSVGDDGPVAYAIVLDEAENPVSTPSLSINGRPMDIDFFSDPDVDGSGTEEGYPYYSLDLPDLKGGDTVQFLAVSPSGAKIYAPPSAVIPMAIELLDPQEGQEITAGDEVLIRWTGGEGAELFSVAYAALDGSAMYSVEEAPGGTGSVTIPGGQTVQGDAVLGVGAISGDIHVMNSFDKDFISQESYFLISRNMGIATEVRPTVIDALPYRRTSAVCPFQGMGDVALAACMGQFAAFGIGAIVWENRRQCELKRSSWNETCRTTTNNFMYCQEYGRDMGHLSWYTGCIWCYKTSGNPPYNWVECQSAHPGVPWKPCQPGPCPK